MSTQVWSLAAIDRNGVDHAVARLADGTFREIAGLPEGLSPIDIVKDWARFEPILKAWTPNDAKTVVGRLVAPLRYPGKLVCVGANYSDHRREMETAPDGGPLNEPFFLMKPPTTAIVGPDDDILVRGDADRVDWEGEVAIVIGKRGRFIARDDALSHIAGYMLANDVSARGCHPRENPIHGAFAFDWVSSKGQDTFCPIGPAMTPSWFISDPDDIPFSLAVNGVVEQSGTTANLIADIRSLIVSLSQYMTLEEGDIIATGTPSGVGVAKGRFLVDGDVVELSSPLLGTFVNRVRGIGSARPAADAATGV